MPKLTAIASPGSAAQGAIDVDLLVRNVLFIAVFMAVWVSFHPFQSLAEPPPELAEGGDRANQIGFSTLFLALAIWTYAHDPSRLTLLFRPALFATLAWFVVSVVASWEPSLAGRRLVFTLIVMSIAAMMLLLPRNLRHFADLLATAVLLTLAICYLGLVLVPQLAIHQATDFLEPEHAGNWRGTFPHKNQAGATMVIFIFIGLFVMRLRSAALGVLIVALSGIFLLFTQSKTAIAVLPLVLILSSIVSHTRKPALAIGLVLSILFIFNLLSVGSVYFESVHTLLTFILPDASFTGRTDIWQAALQYVFQRPITGYGFASFWGTPEVVFGLGESATWVSGATDAHNAYLNLALTIGVPGLALVIIWMIVLPISDYFRLRPDADSSPLHLLFLRVCLYGIYASCFESSIFQQVGEVWFTFMASVFGLRYLSMTRVMA